MAKIKINLKTFCDAHVKPVLQSQGAAGSALGVAYNVFMDTDVPFIGSIGDLLNKDFDIDLPGLPALPAAPVVQPINPTAALNDIAKAIKQAETTLLGENLSIRNASVDVELTVAVGEAAGASAKFNLQIGPTPAD